jgi:hypothetical protein
MSHLWRFRVGGGRGACRGAVVVAMACALWVGPQLALSDTAGEGSFEERERARIRAHLEEVEAELRARDVSELTAAQRRARAHHVEVLRAYRERGVFPKNTDFPGQKRPYFRDQEGTLCAMAYLIEASGGAEFVDRIARTRNNAYVPELVDEPELVAWLEAAGMTVEEAARVQPGYCSGHDWDCACGAMAMPGIAKARVEAIRIDDEGERVEVTIERVVAEGEAMAWMEEGAVTEVRGGRFVGVDDQPVAPVSVGDLVIVGASYWTGERVLLYPLSEDCLVSCRPDDPDAPRADVATLSSALQKTVGIACDYTCSEALDEAEPVAEPGRCEPIAGADDELPPPSSNEGAAGCSAGAGAGPLGALLVALVGAAFLRRSRRRGPPARTRQGAA